jgi:hypothetical protein
MLVVTRLTEVNRDKNTVELSREAVGRRGRFLVSLLVMRVEIESRGRELSQSQEHSNLYNIPTHFH